MHTPTIEEIRDSIEFLQYRDTFSRVLCEMLGWPIARGRLMVDECLQDSGFRLWFGHQSPILYAAPLLARAMMFPADFQRVGRDANLHREIAWAIQGTGDDYDDQPDTNPNYDWESARRRVQAVIAIHVKRAN